MHQTIPTGRERVAFLTQRRDWKMARSAHAFVRGNTQRFYEWLEGHARVGLPEGPAVWICGDCHVGNLGPVADAQGDVDIQIRDLDQTVVGNPVHDLVRLGLSLTTAARNSNLPGIVTARMLERMVRGYAAGIHATDEDDGPQVRSDIVRTIKRRALGRRWKHLAKERLGTSKPRIPLGRRFFAIDEEERDAIEHIFEDGDVRRLALTEAASDAHVEFLDAAYWLKGCSSLGFLRYAALFEITEADGDRSLALVDIKEAVEAVAPAAIDATMPLNHAERVVAGARALSPNLGDRMLPATLLDRPVVARELLPQDLKLDIEQFNRKEAIDAATYLAHVVGRAHGRQMDLNTRCAWRNMIARGDGTDDAPSWLWESVVDLAGRHETGYLRHCRVYANAA